MQTLPSLPHYLLRNAETRPERVAMRHKDLGIWHEWTWGELLEEIRALSIGLLELGLAPGDRVAIVGANRPRLYWTFAAVQCALGVPVPVYADSVAEEMVYVLEHAGVRFAVCQDQEQVDKVGSVRDRLPALETLLYDESRGLRDLDEAERARRTRTCSGSGAGRSSAIRSARRPGCAASTRSEGGRALRAALHLRHDRAPEGRHAQSRQPDRHLPERQRLRRARPGRGDDRLPPARLGRGPRVLLRPGADRRLLRLLSREPRHRDDGSARDRPDLLLRPAARVRGAADDDHRDDGGRRPAQARDVRSLHRRRPPPRRGDPERGVRAASSRAGTTASASSSSTAR